MDVPEWADQKLFVFLWMRKCGSGASHAVAPRRPERVKRFCFSLARRDIARKLVPFSLWGAETVMRLASQAEHCVFGVKSNISSALSAVSLLFLVSCSRFISVYRLVLLWREFALSCFSFCTSWKNRIRLLSLSLHPRVFLLLLGPVLGLFIAWVNISWPSPHIRMSTVSRCCSATAWINEERHRERPAVWKHVFLSRWVHIGVCRGLRRL